MLLIFRTFYLRRAAMQRKLQHALSTHYEPGTMLSSLHVLAHGILRTTCELGTRYCPSLT